MGGGYLELEVVLHGLAVDQVLHGVFLAHDREDELPDALEGDHLDHKFGVQVLAELLLGEDRVYLAVANFEVGAEGAEVGVLLPGDAPALVVLEDRVNDRGALEAGGGYPE